jgi:PBP1b-binding outer membrane lipoprotein LpoB
MKAKLILSTLALLAVIAAGCAPEAGLSTEPAPEITQPTAAIAGEATPTAAEATTPATITGEATPAPVATSRGDQLVATDPSTVNLASGKPTLLEFFRFT